MKKIMFLSLVVGMFCGGNNAVAKDTCTFPDNKQYDVGAEQEYDCPKHLVETGTFVAEAITGKKCYLSCMKKKISGAVESVWSVKECASESDKQEIFSLSLTEQQAYTTPIPGFKKCVKGNTPGECEEGEEKATKDDAKIRLSTPCKGCNTLKEGECYSKKMLECYRAMSENNDVGWNGYDKCFCKKGKSFGLWLDGKCGVSEELTFCQKLQKKEATKERMACCWAGKDTEWVGANGDNAKDSTGKEGEYCKCTSEDMNWDETEKKCKAKKAADNNTECSVTINVDVKCENGRFFKEEKVFTTTKEKAEDCSKWEAALRDEINSLTNKTVSGNANFNIKELDDLIAEVCKVSATDIENAKLKMEAFFKTAADEASVWKTESGSFNSARLASDLTAGVVLGTVGGIVTGNIIKKNQIKKGYEVLHCTIGGQTVADWGDEFNVGLNR